MVHWWGWSDKGYPSPGDWLPPADGVDEFQQAIEDLRKNGVETKVFINITNILRSSEFWENNKEKASEWVQKNKDGSFVVHNGKMGRYQFMRVETTHPGWKTYLYRVFDTIIEAGAKELRLDGFPWVGVPDCFDQSHDHPPGHGGSWYTKEAKAHLQNIRSRYRDQRPELAISGEGITEVYLDEMTAHNTRDVMAEVFDSTVDNGDAELIPLLNYTLGDYYLPRGMLYTPISTVNNPRPMLRLWLGRSLVKGMLLNFRQPTGVNHPNVDDRMIDYIGRIGRARETYANRFLVRGTLLRQPEFDTDSVSLTAWGGKWKTETDVIHASAWKSENEEIGVIFTNVSNSDELDQVTFELDAQPFKDIQSGLLYSVHNGDYIRHDQEEQQLEIELEPEDVHLVVSAPSSPQREQALTQIVKAQEGVSTSTAPSAQAKLSSAKRAFEHSRLSEARKMAQQAISKANSPTETEPPRSTTPSTSTEPVPTTSGSRTQVATESSSPGSNSKTTTPDTRHSPSQPGFGILTALSGLGGLWGVRKWWSSDRENKE